jgi:hypothetical protein
MTKLFIRLLILLVLAITAYFWANALMDSLYAYRSPLRQAPPAPGQPLKPAPGSPVTRRVVFVLIDALRLDTASNPEVMPYLNQLRQQGAWAAMHSRPPSYSSPSYTVLLTGAWPDLSDGPALNLDYENTPTWTQDNLFSAAARAGLRTAVSGWYIFEKLIPQEAVNASFYTAGEDRQADIQVVEAALPWLQGDYQFVLIHLDQVDYAGHHEGGPRDPRWNSAARRADDLLRQIAARLDLAQDTLFVCSDHGQIDAGGHGGQDAVALLEPFMLVGAGVRPGNYGDVDMVDVAPTLAALLGTNIPASSQGHIRSELLALPAQELDMIPVALQAQQSQLVSAYQAAIGAGSGNPITTPAGQDNVKVYQAALENAHLKRLNAERIPRLLVALVAVLLPPVFLMRKRGRERLWLLGAAVIFVVLFNLRYAVLDQRTYSLSTVISSNELIQYCALTAALALLVSWLVFSLGMKVFRQPPRQAAEHSLDLALATSYLVALPLLYSFVMNGAVITWTLPGFLSMYLGFLATIQILIVAVVGLVLAGVAGLVSWVVK